LFAVYCALKIDFHSFFIFIFILFFAKLNKKNRIQNPAFFIYYELQVRQTYIINCLSKNSCKAIQFPSLKMPAINQY